MRNIHLSSVIVGLGLMCLGVVNFANASSVIEVCRLDAKIVKVTEEYVFVDITDAQIYNNGSVLCTSIDKDSDYKIIRDNFLKNAYRESIFVGQDIVIDGVSGNAMGPDGAVFWDSWELESAGGNAIKLPITLEKTTSFVADNMYALSEIINRSGQPNEVIIYTEGYITGVSKCTEYEIKNQIVGCGPEGMLAVSQDISGKGIGVNVIQDYQNPVDVNNVKIGGKYKISIKTGGLSGSSLKLVSLKLLDANVTNNSLVEGRTYTVAELNKNTSITPKKFFTEAYVVMNSSAVSDFDGSLKFNFFRINSKIAYAEASRPEPVNVLVISDKKGDVTNEIQAGRKLYGYEIQFIKPRDIDKNLKINTKYRFELFVGKFANVDRNNITLVSVKNLDGSAVATTTGTSPQVTDNQMAKRSFFARLWGWFINLFR